MHNDTLGRVLLGAAVAVVGGFTALAAYNTAHPRPPRPISEFSAQEIISRSDTHPVRECANGASVYRWRQSSTYVYYKPGGAFFDAGASVARLPAGMTPAEFCS
jgi:hypothetical protein